MLIVARPRPGRPTLGDHRSYDFLVNGEVLQATSCSTASATSSTSRPRDVAGDSLPLVFQRYLRPGDYRLIVKLEDINAGASSAPSATLTVPAVDKAAPPPPPADAETARLLAEANAAIANGETTVKLMPPHERAADRHAAASTP